MRIKNNTGYITLLLVITFFLVGCEGSKVKDYKVLVCNPVAANRCGGVRIDLFPEHKFQSNYKILTTFCGVEYGSLSELGSAGPLKRGQAVGDFSKATYAIIRFKQYHAGREFGTKELYINRKNLGAVLKYRQNGREESYRCSATSYSRSEYFKLKEFPWSSGPRPNPWADNKL